MLKKMICLIIIFSASCSTDKTAGKISAPDELILKQKQMTDMESLVIYRNGLRKISEYVISAESPFKKRPGSASMIPGTAREEIKSIWSGICDYYLAIDSIDSYHRDHMRLTTAESDLSFHICRASMLMQYRFALDFIEVTEKVPGLAVILNDSIPEIGLPAGTYDSFKFRYLNVAAATEFAAFEAVSLTRGKPGNSLIENGINEDRSVIWKTGTWKGEAMTIKNGADILMAAGKKTWFPVQKGISNLAGDTKVYRLHNSLITSEQIAEITTELKPGDIILERREWYLTNIGIPGFWTHAAIYIGTPEERKRYFQDSSTAAFLKEEGAGSVEDILKKNRKAYLMSITPDSSGHAPRVIEAIGEGVLFTTIEHSASCDSIAVLRPRLTKKDIARALIRAFGYSGRPYDFDFDFLTDSSLVCTELVYKSFEPGVNFAGIKFPMEKLMGRNILPANGIAEMYAAELKKTDRQLDLILFYDGIELKKKAVRSTGKNFVSSIKRPKWHILLL